MAETKYRRLTRPRRRRNGFFESLIAPRSSLWLGADHVLNIDSNRYTEEYKRFYFRDIQAITICGTRLRAIWNGVLTILLTLTLGWSAALWPSRFDTGTMVGLVVLLIFAGCFAVALAGNNLLGPTCSVYIRTAVQTEESPSLGRIRRAHRVLDRIRPLIVAAQGELRPEELAARLRDLNESFVASAMAAAPAGSGHATDSVTAPEYRADHE